MENGNEKELEKVENQVEDKDQIILALAKDLVEMSLLVQKVVGSCALPFSVIKDAEILVEMTNQVLKDFVKKDTNEEKVD